jgi:hypothetical protein
MTLYDPIRKLASAWLSSGETRAEMRYDEFWAQGLCTSTAVTE